MSKDVSKLADEMLSRLENRVYQSSGGEMEINSMNVFRGLCGAYGSAAVLSKFSNGVLNDDGVDMGMLDAHAMWANSLRMYDMAMLKEVIAMCIDTYIKWPPNLPEFLLICRACKRSTEDIVLPAINYNVDEKKFSQNRENALRFITQSRKDRPNSLNRAEVVEGGLDDLKIAIATAVRDAGGDDAVELLRLDRMLNAKVVPMSGRNIQTDSKNLGQAQVF